MNREHQRLLEEQVVLVDPDDTAVGVASKLRAHREGRLHRAVSVFVYDSRGALLLQRRAAHKYHSPGLWSNTCCGHPRPGESADDAARRRLREEMGLECELVPAFRFVYRAPLDDGLWEHELDHVYVGRTDAPPVADPDEVSAWRRVTPAELAREIAAAPEAFTVWFRLLLDRLTHPPLPPLPGAAGAGGG